MNDDAGQARTRFDRPIFIVSTPRSGSTLLFETMEKGPGLYTAGSESHGRIEMVPGLFPGHRGWDSNRLDAVDATPERIEILARNFLADLADREGAGPTDRFRMLEKTPKNALRVPFFAAAWPDSVFVYLYRDVRETLASMMEAWQSPKFKTYPRLPGWAGPPWSLLLVPGWRELQPLSLQEIVARQWTITTEILLHDLEAMSSGRVKAVRYSELLANPQDVMERLTASLDLSWDVSLGSQLPLSKTTVSQPGKDKWRRFEKEITSVFPVVAEADARARSFVDARSV